MWGSAWIATSLKRLRDVCSIWPLSSSVRPIGNPLFVYSLDIAWIAVESIRQLGTQSFLSRGIFVVVLL